MMHFGKAALFAALVLPTVARAQLVTDEQELRDAFANAAPGAVITLADGDYSLNAALATGAAGTAGAPIVVRSQTRRGASIISNGQAEAIFVTHPYWSFEQLTIVA